MPADDSYSTIRKYLDSVIGEVLVEVTQHDEDDYKRDGDAFVSLHFENGKTVTFHIGEFPDGIEIDK